MYVTSELITFEHKNPRSDMQNVYTFWLIESVNIYFESSLVIILLLSVKCKIPEKLFTDLPAVSAAELFNFRREMNRIPQRHCNPCQNSLERVVNIKKAQEIQVVDKVCSNTSNIGSTKRSGT